MCVQEKYLYQGYNQTMHGHIFMLLTSLRCAFTGNIHITDHMLQEPGQDLNDTTCKKNVKATFFFTYQISTSCSLLSLYAAL